MTVPLDSSPPPAAEAPASPTWSRRPLRGGIVALLAGIGMAPMAFLPWLSSPIGEDPTGWDLFDAARDAGDNPFFTTEFFADQFSPFFGGPVAIIAAGLMIAAALVVLRAPRIPQPAPSTIPAAWAIPAQIAAFIAVALPMVCLYTLAVVQRTPKLVDPGAGLLGWIALGVVGFMALIIGCAGRRQKRAKR